MPRRRFWLGMFLCAIVATGASCYGHYYIIVMPFLALLNGAGICILAERLAERLGRPVQPIKWMLTVLVMLLVLKPDVPWLTCSRARFAEVKMGQWSPFLESQLVAGRIDELSSPADPVFIAGSEPQILCYAKRSSPTRFITVYSLMIPSPVAQSYQQEAIRDLQKQPPKLIVLVQSPSSWLRQEKTPLDFFVFLDSLLKQNYELVGGYVKNGKKNHWSEPLSDGEAANSSLLLFRRKQ